MAKYLEIQTSGWKSKRPQHFIHAETWIKGLQAPSDVFHLSFFIYLKKNLKTGWKYYSSWYTQLTFQEFKKGLRIILILKQINRWFHKIHCLGLPSMLWFQRILEKRSQWKWSEGVHQDCEDPGGFQVLLQERESNTWSTFPNFCFPVNQPISTLFLFSIIPKRFAQLL